VSVSAKRMALPRAMYPLAALAQVALRLGLAKPVVGAYIGRALSESKQRKAFAGYVPTRDDVFVATFAKSGTNWMMQIAQQIAHRGGAEFDHIHDVVPWPDSPMPIRRAPLVGPTAAGRSPTGLRVIKTHLPADHVPHEDASTYLTVLRDPKEVVVSSYHFILGIVGATRYVSHDEWFEFVAGSKGLLGVWAKHTASFWRLRDRANTLVLTYPEVKEDPRDCIMRVAAVMGVELTASEFDKVVERASFSWMKQHESQFAPHRMPFVRETPLMIRRGETGGADEMFSPDQQAAIDRMCRAELQRLGSDFPYETAFVQAKHQMAAEDLGGSEGSTSALTP